MNIGNFDSLAGLVSGCTLLADPFSEIGFVFSEPALEALALGGWTPVRNHLAANAELALKGGRAKVAVGFRVERTLLFERVVVISDAELPKKNKIFFWELERNGEWRMKKSRAGNAPEWFLDLSVRLRLAYRDHRNDIGVRHFCVPDIGAALRLAADQIAKFK